MTCFPSIQRLLRPQGRFALLCILVGAALLALTNLTTLEIQPSDEGYYALRAKAIVEYGCWLDQTEYAVGGFYSSSHPPLLIWLMAATAKVLGVNTFSFRIWSVIAFVLCVWCVYDCTRSGTSGEYSSNQALSNQTASILVPLAAALAATLSPMMLWYGRMAQFDMLVTMLSAAQVMLYLRYLNSQKPFYIWCTGIALGLALLSKTFVGGFAAAAIVLHSSYMLASKRITVSQFVRQTAIIGGVGLALGFSWFAAVCLLHEGFFERYIRFFVMERFTVNQTDSKHITGTFYFLNVALTRIPLVGVLPIWIAAFVREKTFRTPARVLILVWFAVPFFILSAASTKLLWYALLFFPPLFVMTGEAVIMIVQVYSIQFNFIAVRPHYHSWCWLCWVCGQPHSYGIARL